MLPQPPVHALTLAAANSGRRRRARTRWALALWGEGRGGADASVTHSIDAVLVGQKSASVLSNFRHIRIDAQTRRDRHRHTDTETEKHTDTYTRVLTARSAGSLRGPSRCAQGSSRPTPAPAGPVEILARGGSTREEREQIYLPGDRQQNKRCSPAHAA